MSDIPETGRQSHDSILKTTTTWGARLALLTLITLLAAGLSFADGKKHKLSKDLDGLKGGHNGAAVDVIIQFNQAPTEAHHQKVHDKGGVLKTKLDFINGADRKSTRLNSSHITISYAVFCLKKKKSGAIIQRPLAPDTRDEPDRHS